MTTTAATSAPTARRIDVNMMSPEALSQARHTVSSEVEYMSESASALRKAMALFEQARLAAEKMSDCTEGQPSLIPITNSLYMRGEVVSPQKLVVDIGTGYYVEMSSKRAVDFYKRKVDFVRGQLTALRQVIDEKTETVAFLTEALQKKIQALSTVPSQQQPAQ